MDAFEEADASAAPAAPATARSRHNFCAASSRDTFVFGCCRPGHTAPTPGVASSPRGPLIPAATVQAWVQFLQGHGVARVVVLLTDDELTFFATPYLGQLRKAFAHVVHVPPHRHAARASLLDALEAAEIAKEKVVVHCTTGQGRTGNVLALWLHHRYRLSIQQAVGEVTKFAASSKCARLPTEHGVMRLLAPPADTPRRQPRRPLPPPTPPPVAAHVAATAASTAAKTAGGGGAGRKVAVPRLPVSRDPDFAGFMAGVAAQSAGAGGAAGAGGPASSPTSTVHSPGTARSASSMASHQTAVSRASFLSVGSVAADPAAHISFIQTGGTIDKDYPRSHRGYAFEIGSAAAKRIVSSLQAFAPPGFTCEFHTVCRKDSQDISDADRAEVVAQCAASVGSRVVVTHGTDSLVQSAQYVLSAFTKARAKAESGSQDASEPVGLASKTIVFTGALRPERFVDSDAAFNVGGAVVAATLLPPGVYVSMHGRVFQANQCRRNTAGTLVPV